MPGIEGWSCRIIYLCHPSFPSAPPNRTFPNRFGPIQTQGGIVSSTMERWRSDLWWSRIAEWETGDRQAAYCALRNMGFAW